MTQFKPRWSMVCFCFVVTWLVVFVLQVGAETLKWRFVVGPPTKMERIDVGDAKEHSMGVFERNGVAFFEGGKVATLSVIGTLDTMKQSNAYLLYAVYTFDDGSTIVGKSRGTITPEGVRGAKAEFVSGSGQFAGITGSYTPKATSTKNGFLHGDAVGTYTLRSQ